MKSLRIGTRGSLLALWQANWVKAAIERVAGAQAVELVPIKTTGDQIQDVPLVQVGGKGLFTKELDEALIDGRIDLAVHSLKDVPFEIPARLEVIAIPQREEPWDAFIGRGPSLAQLPAGTVVGTGSLRRQIQLQRRFPSLKVVGLRGNVDTRLRKIDSGQCDGIVLALAGLRRLGYEARITEVLGEDTMLPAIGQGALAIVGRRGDAETLALTRTLDHAPSRLRVTAERALLRALQGSCQVPIAGLARIGSTEELRLQGWISSLDGSQTITDEVAGPAKDAESLGSTLGRRMLDAGADRIVAEIRSHGAGR